MNAVETRRTFAKVVAASVLIVAVGFAADLYAKVIILDDGDTCFVCTNAPQSAQVCNSHNANFQFTCQQGEDAHCDFNNLTGQVTHTCTASLQPL